MARKVRLFVHRNRGPTHRGRHRRDDCGTGMFRCTVAIKPLQDANGYDFAQDTHYVGEKRPMVKEDVKGAVCKDQQEWQQGSLMESTRI